MIVDPAPWWRLLAEASYVDYLQRGAPRQILRATSVFRLTRDVELKLGALRRIPYQEAAISLYRYF